MNNKNQILSLVHWNCFKLTIERIEELRLFIEKFKPDIISLNELKLDYYECNFFLNFDGYCAVFRVRQVGPGSGGGVALLINKNICFSNITMFDEYDFEIVAISLNIQKTNLIVASYYNPPDSLPNRLVFEKLDRSGSEYIICGDFNSKMECFGCTKRNRNGEYLLNILNDFNCILIYNNKPTYFSFSNSNNNDVLDMFIHSSALAEKLFSLEVYEEELNSDHAPINAKFNFGSLKNNNKAPVINPFDFDFNRADWQKFKTELNTHPSDHITGNIDSLNIFITTALLKSAKLSIPLRNSGIRAKSLPIDIVRKIDERKYIRKLIRKQKKNELKPEYNKLTKIIKEKISEFRNKQWMKCIDKVEKSSSSKPLWDTINRFRNGKTTRSIPTLYFENQSYETTNDKANLFALILKRIFNCQDNQNDHEITYTFNTVSSYDHLIEKITITQLNGEINSLKTGSPGADYINNLMLKNCSNEFKTVILLLFNKCIEYGKIPSSWKKSRISMIPKKSGYSSDPNEYRPISLTSCLCKLFEKIIHDRIIIFLNEQKIITKCQSGFRKNRSTKDHLLFMTQKIEESLTRKKRVCALFFDISKAFDCVWHAGLIYKLINYKIPGYLIRIIYDFLFGRSFFVQVDGESSEYQKITNGVPQGSVLGPLLFTLYINDIPLVNDKNKAYSFLYADDLTNMFIFRKSGRITLQIKSYLNKLEKWLIKWKFKLSVKKCCYTVFSNNASCKERYELKIFDEKIGYNKNPTILGVILDESLCFNQQVNKIREKCLSRLNLIKILSNKFWKLTRNTLLMLYKALIASVLDYCSFFVHSISPTNLKRIQAIQNRAIRSIYKQPFDSPTNDLCRISNLSLVFDRAVELNERFIAKGIEYNEWIGQLVDEFIHCKNSFKNNNTLLHFYIRDIIISF